MCKLIIFLFIFISLLTEKCQIEATIPLAGVQEIPCTSRDETEPIISPATGFWTLNQTNFEVNLRIIPQGCIYQYTVTRIGIREEGTESGEDVNDYFITYKINNIRNSTSLTELSTSTNIGVMNDQVLLVDINPLLIEELSISRFIDMSGNYPTRYRIIGSTTPREGRNIGLSPLKISVLSYLIAQPKVNIDDTYTGRCNGEVCYGGRGLLMDGVIGSQSDDATSELYVGWRCNTDDMSCDYPLRILLTGRVNVSHLVFHGLKTGVVPPQNSEVVYPQITIIQPDIPTNQTVNEISTNTYSIEIPINRVTDEIFLYMNIPNGQELMLSEVEVFIVTQLSTPNYTSSIMSSSSIPITTTSIMSSPSTPTPTPIMNPSIMSSPSIPIMNPNTTTVLLTVFPLIIVSLILLLLAVSAFSTYKYIKSRSEGSVKNNPIVIYVNPTSKQLESFQVKDGSRIPVQISEEIYQIIPDCEYDNTMAESNNKHQTSTMTTLAEAERSYEYASTNIMPAIYETVPADQDVTTM